MQDPGLTFDQNVAAVVKTLMATRGLDGQTLAPLVGMTKSTMYLRLNGKAWTAAELDRIAAYFEITPVVFFEPVSSLVGTRTGSSRTPLTGIDGDGDTLARRRRDPNQLELDLRPNLHLVTT